MQKKEGKFLNDFFSTKFFLLGLILIAGFVVFVYAKGFYQDFKIKREVESLQKEIDGLESKKLESMEILSYVMSDNFVEEKARTELNMQKDGENIVFFNLDKNFEVQNNDSEGEGENIKSLNNPLKWWYYFTNKSIK